MEQTEVIGIQDAAADNLYPALFQCFTIILSGYVAGRLNIVSPIESKGIATFVGTFALPSLIFLSLARLDFITVNWMFLLAILIAKGLIFVIVIVVTLIVSKPLNLGRAGIFAIFCTQSNDFALGYPIINAIYENTHPEYALYLYLMAPISLAILNPIAFVLMEVNKQRENDTTVSTDGQRRKVCKLKLMWQILKGIAYNPVLMMTVLGITGNITFKHHLSVYIEGLLEVFGQSFSACALFLLGLHMVGQIHRLRGPAMLLPFVLIMVKLIVLPVVMRESVVLFQAGSNETDTSSLSTYAFLYGTIPTAPAVFVFSNLYQLEVDLMASSMVICTFISAPIMFISAEMISIDQNYVDQLKNFGFGLSIVALIATLWVLIVFIVTKKYKRMPHKMTFCLVISQLLLAISVIWGGQAAGGGAPTWSDKIQQSLRIFGMYSCLMWTSMLSIGLLFLQRVALVSLVGRLLRQSRGAGFLEAVWPVLAFMAWGAPGVIVGSLLATDVVIGEREERACDIMRLCLLIFCLTVTTGSLLTYMRFWRRSAQYGTFSSEAGAGPSPDETTSLVEHTDQTSHSVSVSINGCYGTITATPSPNKSGNGCCTNDPRCENRLVTSQDIEDIGDSKRVSGELAACECECACTCAAEAGPQPAPPGAQPPRGRQLLRHTVLIIVYSLSMFIAVTFTTWRMMKKDENGVFVEIEFLDIAANYGQGLVMFVLFGLNPEEIIIPAMRYIRMKWHGGDTVVLPPIEELSFETKHVCDQFITHHLDRCKEAIAKDTRWRMRVYRGVFRGSCLVRWLVGCGLARDERAALQYGRHLLDGRLIAHINNKHHFTNSPMLYTFK